jgi:hypothetical protein
MEFKIKSSKMNQTITFIRPGTGYIFADLGGRSNAHWSQISKGGAVMSGPSLCYTGNEYDGFVRTCRRWFRQYIKAQI